MKLLINRSGSFTLLTNSATNIRNQCGFKGQPLLNYRVEIETSPKHLDSAGFIIDNRDIHNYFEETYGFGRWETLTELPSCERIAMIACDHFKSQLSGCRRVLVGISGDPESAWITAEWSK